MELLQETEASRCLPELALRLPVARRWGLVESSERPTTIAHEEVGCVLELA